MISLCRFTMRLRGALLLVFVLMHAAAAHPALWKVTSIGATGYLFGTVHALPKNTPWMDDTVRHALAQSAEIWTEADTTNLSEAVDALRHYGFGSPGETQNLLPPTYRARFAQEIRRIPVSPVVLEHARPWLAEILLSSGALARSSKLQSGVESTLRAYAHEHNKLLPTFETVDSQFALLADMPLDAQLASLENTIDEFDDAGPVFAEMLKAWLGGDEKALDKLVDQDLRAKSEAVWTELILRRNENFVEKIGDRLQGTGTFFVAVGAGHLCGSDGLPELLKRRGFTVTRIE